MDPAIGQKADRSAPESWPDRQHRGHNGVRASLHLRLWLRQETEARVDCRWVPPTKSALCHYFINGYDNLVAHAIMLVKESASEQRKAHGLQIVWHHHKHQ